MRLLRLNVRHFRNFEEAHVEFSSGLNEIIGENAQGKTSLLEAIYMCLTGTSFRSLHLKELIKHGKSGFFIEAHFEKHGATHQVALTYDGQARKVFLNRALCPSATILLGLMTGVASTPEDVDLIKGPPSVRRRFLDLQIAQVDPLYVHHLNRYAKALKQRNALLKNKQEATITCWEEELANSAAYIVLQRQKNIAFLSEKIPSFFAHFSTEKEPLKKPFQLLYSSSARDQQDIDGLKSYFIHEYARKRAQELLYGMTLVGPHRDDLHIVFDGRPFREFASEGQQHLGAISLKLAEWHFIKQQAGDLPLMILDDFATSLDTTRRMLLFEELQQLGQVFLSSHASLGNFSIRIHAGAVCFV